MTGDDKLQVALLGTREHTPSFIRVSDRRPGDNSRFESNAFKRNANRPGVRLGLPVPVEAVRLDGTVMGRYNSYKEAGAAVGCNQSSIGDAVSNGTLCRGYRWRRVCNSNPDVI